MALGRGMRQLKIIELVNTYNIETQTELTNMVEEAGFEATQATISRDIKELGIIKVMMPNRRYKYVYGQAERSLNNKFSNLFKESVLSIRAAGNIVCVKTIVGSANSACAFIDNLALEEIIGSIAGDDTIMLVVADTGRISHVMAVLEGYLD